MLRGLLKEGGTIMAKRSITNRLGNITSVIVLGILVLCCSLLVSPVNSKERLIYSCSAQVYEAFENERINAFTKETKIPVDLYIATSYTSIERLKHGFCGISSTVMKLDYRLIEEGYVEIPFCKDPLAVIVNEKCKVKDLPESQIQGIFGGEITNWKELGGPEAGIVVVIPRRLTGAYRNFSALFMGRHQNIRHDIMTDRSTFVIEVVKRFPNAISFISRASAVEQEGIRFLNIGGMSPTEKDYPYYQTFSFVTKGRPSGAEKKFIDFAFSKKGLAIMKKRGMTPIK
jgi:phosphate transport system substrate-binding protein